MALQKKHLVYLEERLKGKSEEEAFRVAYPKTTNPGSIKMGCYRLSKNVAIAERLKEETEKLTALATQSAATALTGALVGNVLNSHSKRVILFKIANGEIQIPTVRPVLDKLTGKWVDTITMEVPTATERMKAIELDNAITGEGWRPPDPTPNAGGTVINNTVIRKTVFKTHITTAKAQTVTANGE